MDPNNNQNRQPSSGISSDYTMVVAIILSLSFIVVLAKTLHFLLRWRREQDDGRPGAGGRRRADAGAPKVQPPIAVTVEVQAGPVVCMYRRADGWREATCPVCLSDFADGEAVRVLPTCMHYFHATCVDEWLRARTSCPLCRAAPAGVATASSA